MRGLIERFRRNKVVTLDQDPRWRRFNGHGKPCSCCGRTLNGMFDIGFDHPDPWPYEARDKSGKDVLKFAKDYLSSDLCVIDGQAYVRAVVLLPVIEAEQSFGFGCWGSVSEDTFKQYLDSAENNAPFEGGFSWLSNILPTFEEAFDQSYVPCNLVASTDGQRPFLEAQEGPLAKAQRDGITFDHLLDIYAATGNDLRPHLLD